MSVKTYRKTEKKEIIETNISNNKEILHENLESLKTDYNKKKMEKLRKDLKYTDKGKIYKIETKTKKSNNTKQKSKSN